MYSIKIWPFCYWILQDFLISFWCSKYLCTSCSPSFSLRPLVGLLIACKHGELCRTTDLWWAHLISSEIEGWKSWKHGVNVAVSRQLELCFSSAVASFQGHNWVQFFLFFLRPLNSRMVAHGLGTRPCFLDWIENSNLGKLSLFNQKQIVLLPEQ